MKYEEIYTFLMELDKLKVIYRRSYLSDESRNENSAEHSWHLAMSILLFQDEMKEEIDLLKTLKMALVHDVCEIGAGDISIFDKDRDKKTVDEREYITSLDKKYSLKFTNEIVDLWEEYEKQESSESKWVRVFDRLLPFCLNLVTNGKLWKEQNIRKHQVLEINKAIKNQSPEMYKWMLEKIDFAVEKGWLEE